MSPTTTQLVAKISPSGRVLVQPRPVDDPDYQPLSEGIQSRVLDAFERSSADGILLLGVLPIRVPLHPSVAFWRDFGQAFVATISMSLNPDARLELSPPPLETPEEWLLNLPPMRGAEIVSSEMLRTLWRQLYDALQQQASTYDDGVAGFLRANDSAWNTVGRVFFHLAENPDDPDLPFAFLATYVHKLSSKSQTRHIVLGQALEEYASARDRGKLRSLLAPLYRAAERSRLIEELLQSGEIYHPQAWDTDQAYEFLQEVPIYEQAGLIVRTPDWWHDRRSRPKVSVTIGEEPSKGMGLQTLLDFRVQVTLEGEPIDREELERLLEAEAGLVRLRGKWVEIDREKLRAVLEHWEQVTAQAREGKISFAQAMREMSAVQDEDMDMLDDPGTFQDWSEVVAGKWLAQRLESLYTPRDWKTVETEASIRAVLRPYQRSGVQWLWDLKQLGLGGILADDMGLGKTLQVLTVLALEQGRADPSLAIVPASLVDNWVQEARKFAPHLRVFVAHPSSMPSKELKKLAPSHFDDYDLVITTYAMVLRLPWVNERTWRAVLVDEAQAIKNPAAKITRAIKKIPTDWTVAMTGTPVENSLSDLWSLFDFINPGLLSDLDSFRRFTSRLARREAGYAPLRRLVKPYILRRLKTDRSIISDLPDKTEVNAYCYLSKRQAALYQDTVDELQLRMEERLSRMEWRGVVLSTIMKLKQICNHPSQWLHEEHYPPEDSGKFARLRELCEPIAARQDKVLVFTQFREIIPALTDYLAELFASPGLSLDGQTPVKKRKEIVARFQEEDDYPFLVLSLKAGGTGLNLTAASHVIHFDRWWNPAVENQATDRAFRIGQKKNVLVHKFICRGTIEDHIDRLIRDKIELSRQVLAPDTDEELKLSELDKDQLLQLVSLDMHAALQG